MSNPVIVKDSSKKHVSELTLKRLFAALGVFLVLIGIFAYVAKQVQDGDTLTRDTQILLAINSHSSSFYDTAALAITYTGNILSVVIISILLGIWLYKRRQKYPIVQVAFALGGAIIANALLKLLFQRERPELWQLMTHESTYSFPSGHALITAAFAVTVVIISWKSRFKWFIIAIASLYTLSVGLSRLYLGVHYPTDVVAGWCLGAAWAIVVALIMRVIVLKR